MLTVLTWNILAACYAKPDRYPETIPEWLEPERRIAGISGRLESLAPGLICLQEVERVAFEAIRARLPVPYTAHLALREGKPDGCATLVRADLARAREERVLRYSDGSGYLALLLTIEGGGRVLGVANTHLKWDPPGTPSKRQTGLRQVAELLAMCAALACDAWIVCGDLNVTPTTEVVALLKRSGLAHAHAAALAPTSNANLNARTLDYLFHSASLRAEPVPLPSIGDRTPLPSASEPSDHLPVVAHFDWP